MKSTFWIPVILATLWLTLLLSAQTTPRGLDHESFPSWREKILPTPEELSWESIPWRTRLAEGVAEAQERQLPILLWVMNGHPLGCA